jgi:indolepyruvate ferredoxin oxidoreductase alpha subunit
MVRSTTRVSHSKSPVEVSMPDRPRELDPLPPFERRMWKYVMIPAHARLRHPQIEERMLALSEYAATSPVNRVMWGDRRVGVIADGMAYQYAREVFSGFSLLKLGMVYPLPEQMILDFASAVDRLVVVEELDPFVEEQVRAMGLEAVGKEAFPKTGELTLARVREGAASAGLPVEAREPPLGPQSGQLTIPARPPALCPGCPHRSVYFSLRKLRLLVSGDIGCYAIGVLPPFEEMDMLVSMGASIGMAHGATQAGCPDKVVATIGDSTFFHSGLPALASTIYNQGNACVMILDNRTTAMTGGQEHPGTGVTLQGETTHPIDIEGVVQAMGVEDLWVVDALDVEAVEQAIREAVSVDDRPTVVVVNGECLFVPTFQARPAVTVDPEACNGCGFCFRVGCPAILKSEELDERRKRAKAEIDSLLCTGCTICLQVCPRGAIYEDEAKEA